VVFDDRQRFCYASARACAHFGAADDATLQTQWDDIRGKLDLGDLATLRPGDPPLQRRCDVETPAGTRKLRFELHAVGGASPRYLMLLRERMLIDAADRAQIMASESAANRHLIAGLVHDAKGPLNNLHLTLALLAGAMSRMEASTDPDGMLARCRRYIDVMQTEETRLSGCLNDIHALSLHSDAEPEQLDVSALVRAVARLLRHEARVREARLDIDVPTSAWTFGDAHRLHLALLAFSACLLDAAPPGALITLRVDDGGGTHDIRIDIMGRDVAIPPAVTAAFFRVSGVAASDFPGVLAGRTIVEAHGGDVAILGDDRIHSGFALTLPQGTRPN
jgi:signal transduction histidine kinase